MGERENHNDIPGIFSLCFKARAASPVSIVKVCQSETSKSRSTCLHLGVRSMLFEYGGDGGIQVIDDNL